MEITLSPPSPPSAFNVQYVMHRDDIPNREERRKEEVEQRWRGRERKSNLWQISSSVPSFGPSGGGGEYGIRQVLFFLDSNVHLAEIVLQCKFRANIPSQVILIP